MELSLFQWIGIGLVVAIILIPIVRWFWKRFDMPSKRAQELMKQSKEEAAEARMWQSIEAQVEAEKAAAREIEMKRKENQEKSGKSMSEGESENAWAALGIEVPIQPVEREKPPEVKAEPTENTEMLTQNDDQEKNTQEPDWELISKMSNLDKPEEGVPEALDLDTIVENNTDVEIEEPSIKSEVEEVETIEQENQFTGEYVSTKVDDEDWSVGW